jgi:hypothetical protein
VPASSRTARAGNNKEDVLVGIRSSIRVTVEANRKS